MYEYKKIENLRTKSHESYVTPSDYTILKMARELGYSKPLSAAFVRDIANYISHPHKEREEAFVSPHTWDFKEDAYYLREKNSERRERYLAKKLKYNINIQTFIKSIPVDLIGGSSPVEKAINIIAAQSCAKDSPSTSSEEGEEGLPIFNTDKDAKAGAKEALETIMNLEKVEPNPFTDKVFGGENNALAGIRAANLKPDNLRALKELPTFAEMGAIKAGASKKETEVQYSNVSRVDKITNFFDAVKVPLVQSVLPMYKYKLATKQLTKTKYVEVEYSKQCLVLLIDDSGSMHSKEKIALVKALLINRCAAVAANEAELYINLFESDLSKKWIVVKTLEDAENVWKKFNTYFQFNGGGTDMEHAVTTAIKQLKSGTICTHDGDLFVNLENPQICLINDGEDKVSKTWTPAITTHGFILGNTEHKEMERFCRDSGGTYQRFPIEN